MLRYPYELRYHYPHMRDEDKAIWERFIITNPGYFDSVDYDVPVGSPPDFSTIVSPQTNGDDHKLYRKKIDVVGERPGLKYIIELKPRADAKALGQVLGYKMLYARDIDPNTTLVPMVITDELTKDVKMVAEELKVIVAQA